MTELHDLDKRLTFLEASFLDHDKHCRETRTEFRRYLWSIICGIGAIALLVIGKLWS